MLSSTGDWLKEQLPENAEATILKKLKRQRPEDTEPPEAAPDQHGEIDTPAAGRADVGYDRSSRSGMQHLLEARGMAR